MKPTKLENLLWYYRMTRQKGHTTFMMSGLTFNLPGVILFANNSHAKGAFEMAVRHFGIEKPDRAKMMIGEVRFVPIGWLNNLHEAMRGRTFENMPAIIIDHFALDILVGEHTDEYERRYSKTKG